MEADDINFCSLNENESTSTKDSTARDLQCTFAKMESVSLDTGEGAIRNPSPALEVVTEEALENISSNTGTEENTSQDGSTLQKYFGNDAAALDSGGGLSIFDRLSANTSPMMKSIADITAIQDPEPTPEKQPFESTSVEIADVQRVMFSVGEEADKTSTIENPTSEQQVTDKPVLSSLFSEDRGGSDEKGKAFFDHISSSAEPVFSKVSSPNSFSASVIPTSTSSTSLFLPDSEESERYYSAWIPSPGTQKALIAAVTSAPGTYFPERDQLTMPGVIFEESSMVDPVKVLLNDLQMSSVERPTFSADNVAQDENGVRELIRAKCYHAAINLTARLLTTSQQGPGCGGHPSRHSPYTLQLWYTRLALLIKLRKFSYAEIESEAFGDLDKPDIYYEFYSDTNGGRKGSMAPFAFRILLAELPQYQGNYQRTLEKLYAILAVVEKILQNLAKGLAEDGSMMEISDDHRKASTQLWQKRERDVYYSILNCVLAQRDFVMAVHIVHTLLEKDTASEARLCCALGRIHLQLGDIKAANDCFTRFSELCNGRQSSEVHLQVEELINKAAMAIAQNGYPEAYKYYGEAYAIQPENAMLANNMAVTLLYMGKLKDSLNMLEKTVQSNPDRCLHEGILFNICVLYELESSASLDKKKAMLRLVAGHTGDNFQTSCLKIDNINRNIQAR